MRSDSRARWIVDAVGLALAGALAILALVSDGPGKGDGRPLAALVGAVVVAVIVGRLLGAVHRLIPPLIVVGWAGFLLVTARIPLTPTGPLGGPFGYRNATAAFLAQAAIAALMLAAGWDWWPWRVLIVACGLGLLVLAVDNAVAAGVTLIVALVACLAFLGPRGARSAVAVSGLLVAAALVATVVLGSSYRPGATDPITRALTERRIVLWHDALVILQDHPTGVGPGRFAFVSPTARADADARWAHNGFLQQAAELGWAGLFLTVLLFAWGFVRLGIHPEPDVYVALGAAALAALGIHACVDYVLHFPAIPLVCAGLVGAAQSTPLRRKAS